jgi:hypothetical protein
MRQDEGPRSAWRGGPFITLTILAWLALALSTLGESYVTWILYGARDFVSCAPAPPPVAERLRLVYGGLGFWLVLAIPAFVLLVRARKLGTGIALGLACVSVLVPFVELFLQIFEIGMC